LAVWNQTIAAAGDCGIAHVQKVLLNKIYTDLQKSVAQRSDVMRLQISVSSCFESAFTAMIFFLRNKPVEKCQSI